MNGSVDAHLEAALREADDERIRYHLREALQLRVAQQESTTVTSPSKPG